MTLHKLLHPQRFDICAKHAYARLLSKAGNLTWAQKIYAEHIIAMNGAHEDDPPKHCVQDFFDDFHKLLNSIAKNGYKKSKGIPVSPNDNGLILNGAHRVAACLFYEECAPTFIHKDREFMPTYNYKFLASRGLPQEVLDYMALEYVRLRADCRLAIVWPAAAPHVKLIESVFGQHCDIIYRKTLSVGGNSGFNIIRQVYAGEKWVNSSEKTHAKTVDCVAGGATLYCYVLQADSPEIIDQVKIASRAKTRMENSAMHTTDTQAETLRIARMFFNENSRHFLHYATPNQSPKFIERLAKYQKATDNQDDFAIHGSGVMEVYGLRTANDLDYISTNVKLKTAGKISLDNDKVKYGDLSLNELIYDPRNYFYYNGIKFVRLEIVKQMKQLRNEEKDIADVKLIDDRINSTSDKFSFTDGVGKLDRHKWVTVRREKADRRKKYEKIWMGIALTSVIALAICLIV